MRSQNTKKYRSLILSYVLQQKVILLNRLFTSELSFESRNRERISIIIALYLWLHFSHSFANYFSAWIILLLVIISNRNYFSYIFMTDSWHCILTQNEGFKYCRIKISKIRSVKITDLHLQISRSGKYFSNLSDFRPSPD